MDMYVRLRCKFVTPRHHLWPTDMRFDIGERVVARVERRGRLRDVAEHVGIVQGEHLPPLPLPPPCKTG